MIIVVTLIIAGLQLIQYGGSPMWDRGPNSEYRRKRQFHVYPPPCVGVGDCHGPAEPFQGRPRFEYSPRYDDEWEK